MLFLLDLALRGEPRTDERGSDRLTEPGLGQEEEVVDGATEHDERRDHPRLRREQQRLARVADPERLDVVRHHRLQVGGGIGTTDADELPRASCDP